MTADRSAADTLRDELAEIVDDVWGGNPWAREAGLPTKAADAVLPVVRRYADAQVAAERATRQQRLIGYRVNRGTDADPDWVMYHPHDVEIAYLDTDP